MGASQFTIFGANGFLGSRLVRHLRSFDCDVLEVARDTWPVANQKLGHVIFCIGMTAQFRNKPFETVDRQVNKLCSALRNYKFESFLYISSTRLYGNNKTTKENSELKFRPDELDNIYNLTKATGECLCLSMDNPNIRVVRASNIFGLGTSSPNFISSILHEASGTRRLILRSARTSAKDYVCVNEVVEILAKIACSGQKRLYNLARGRNTTNQEIGDALAAIGIDVSYADDSPEICFSPIDVSRVAREFYQPEIDLTDRIEQLLRDQTNENDYDSF